MSSLFIYLFFNEAVFPAVWWLTSEWGFYTEVTVLCFWDAGVGGSHIPGNKYYWSSGCIAVTGEEKKQKKVWLSDAKQNTFKSLHCWRADAAVSVALACWEWDPDSSGCGAAIANKDKQCHWCEAPEIGPSQYHTCAERQCQRLHASTWPEDKQRRHKFAVRLNRDVTLQVNV